MKKKNPKIVCWRQTTVEKSLGETDKNSPLLHGLHQAGRVQGQEQLLPSESSKTHFQPLLPIPILFMKVLWAGEFLITQTISLRFLKRRIFFNL